MAAAGASDGRYRIGQLEVAVTQGQARLVEADGRPGSIAGSTLTMADAFAFVVGCGVPIPDAARMASTTPAHRHRIDSVGELRVGARADLCVVDDHGRLEQVMHRGRWVSSD
jgi:N-acetylglucosamine-6-phosphate deacetylase